MEKLLRRLGIDENADAEEIVKKLDLKQTEIMERLDNVEDEKIRQSRVCISTISSWVYV